MFWLQVPATVTGVPVLLSDSDNPPAVDIHHVPDVLLLLSFLLIGSHPIALILDIACFWHHGCGFYTCSFLHSCCLLMSL
jgi:hypothetical protein